MANLTRALVLGGGGLFGAYQVGVWELLQREFHPDMVVGASIGSINGWAIAGGCPARDWTQEWLSMGGREQPRFRWPRSLFDGLFDTAAVEDFVRELMQRFPLRLRYGAVLTSIPDLQQKAFWNGDVTWRHICASCGVPLVLKQYQLEGRWWADGGLLSAVPVQSAIAAGANRIVAVDILPSRPPAPLRAGRIALRALAGYRPAAIPEDVRVVRIEPGEALGRWIRTAVWDRDSIGAWIERGREDAERALVEMRRLEILD